MTVAALLMGRISLARIRAILPSYPGVVVLGTYTPSPLYHLFHVAYPTALLVTSAILFALGLFALIKRAPIFGTLVFLLHTVFLLLAVLAYGLSMAQLAGALSLKSGL